MGRGTGSFQAAPGGGPGRGDGGLGLGPCFIAAAVALAFRQLGGREVGGHLGRQPRSVRLTPRISRPRRSRAIASSRSRATWAPMPAGRLGTGSIPRRVSERRGWPGPAGRGGPRHHRSDDQFGRTGHPVLDNPTGRAPGSGRR